MRGVAFADPAGAADHHRPQPLRCDFEALAREHAAQRIADHMSFIELQMVHQPQHVVDHLEAVALRVVRLTAFAVTAKIHRGDVVRPTQRVEEPALDPCGADAEDEAVQQDHRLAVTHDEVVNAHAV